MQNVAFLPNLCFVKKKKQILSMQFTALKYNFSALYLNIFDYLILSWGLVNLCIDFIVSTAVILMLLERNCKIEYQTSNIDISKHSQTLNKLPIIFGDFII